MSPVCRMYPGTRARSRDIEKMLAMTGAKRSTGRKGFTLVDTLGLLMVVKVVA